VMKTFKKKALGNDDEIKDFVGKLQVKIKEKFKEFKENNCLNWMVFLFLNKCQYIHKL